MQTLDWLETHLGSIEQAIKILNKNFCWEIKINEHQGTWYVTSGKEPHVIFSSDSRDAVDAFLYGMGMAIMGIPQHLFEQLSKDMKEWCDSL